MYSLGNFANFFRAAVLLNALRGLLMGYSTEHTCQSPKSPLYNSSTGSIYEYIVGDSNENCPRVRVSSGVGGAIFFQGNFPRTIDNN